MTVEFLRWPPHICNGYHFRGCATPKESTMWPNNSMPDRGWLCPVCNAVNNPIKLVCNNCTGKVKQEKDNVNNP